MESDAVNGRAFEDIVVEYEASYRPSRPLKVFGGQHRITAITEAHKQEVSAFHGIRVYFGLTIEQRLEIALFSLGLDILMPGAILKVLGLTCFIIPAGMKKPLC